ncbi:MAG TPA: hypothetical protein VLD57_01220, partial [Blastocatellia bacterium]|nr:hypothetical protein [Blastocatellia bacterium]
MSETDWATLLSEENVEGLWSGLYHLISRHPAVRPLRFATDGAAVASPLEINADLTQELFLELFQKQRFEHYLYSNYTSADIENELSHIEIPNLVGARLRKRYPESFRMARRVSNLLKTSDRFRRFSPDLRDHESESQMERSESRPARRRGRPPKKAAHNKKLPSGDNELDDDTDPITSSCEEDQNGNHANQAVDGRRRRMVNQMFGLREWKPSKPPGDPGHFAERIKDVAMRRRDRRLVGRSGASQLIISNTDLEDLIVEILVAIDSPADVRTLRQLVLSKVPLQDYNIDSLDERITVDNEGGSINREAQDTRETPESALLREERNERAARLASDFLLSLRRAVNNNERRFGRLLSTLWHCYYDPEGPSQIEIARMLGISDSLVSDNRR